MTAGCLDDAAHLVAGRHVVVDLLQDLPAGVIGGVVGLAERRLLVLFQLFVDRLQTGSGDGLADGAGDGFGAVYERLVLLLSLVDEPGVEAFGDSVHSTEENAPFSEDVGLVFALKSRLEGIRRAECDRPGERVVGSSAVDVLVDGERAVDARAVHLAALLVEPTYGGPHPLRTDCDHIDVLRKIFTDGLQVREQETM